MGWNKKYKDQGQFINQFAKYHFKDLQRPNYKHVSIIDFLKVTSKYFIFGILLICWFFAYSYHKSWILGKRTFNNWEMWLQNISFYILLLVIIIVLLKIHFSKDIKKKNKDRKLLYVIRYNGFLRELEARILSLPDKEVRELLK